MRNDVFIETINVSQFRHSMRLLTDVQNGTPGLGMIKGKAGRGKTEAAKNWHAEHGGIYLYVWEDWTQAAFLQSLCFEACGNRPRGANNSKIQIIDALEKEPRTIIIDEADRLKIARIEDLRDIHEASGCPVVLIGEMGLHTILNSRSRLQSRVTQIVEFGPVSTDDVLVFALQAAQLELTPEACSLVAKFAHGDFRTVRNVVQRLEQAAAAAETNQVDVALVKSVGGRA